MAKIQNMNKDITWQKVLQDYSKKISDTIPEIAKFIQGHENDINNYDFEQLRSFFSQFNEIQNQLKIKINPKKVIY